MMTGTDKAFQVHTVINKRTWSFVHSTGLEVAVITGKKRARAFKSALENSALETFSDMEAFAIGWKKDNKRGY